MTFGRRVALLAALAAAVAVVLAAGAAYVTTRRTLLDDVDRHLRASAFDSQHRPPPGMRPGRFGGPGVLVEIVGLRLSVGQLPVDERAFELARTGGEPYFRTADIEGESVRIYTVPGRPGTALLIGRSIEDVQDSLRRLAGRLVFVGGLGVALAGGLGLVVARRAVAPVRRLTESAEHVAETQDLSHRIEVEGDDEIARLGRTFNAMLASLEEARAAQRQLVADASHELRTPLTSIRTNIEVLAGTATLADDDRRRLITDVVAQLDEFGVLVGALVELARDEAPVSTPEAVRLDEAAAEAVTRARTFHKDVEITLATEPTTVEGDRDRLVRAVSNMVDNAVKHGAGPVEVDVRAAQVTVRDHGPGMAAEDLPHAFDRFWRAPAARGKPGSGLGLSIVEQVAKAHGGTATVENAQDGSGLVVTLALSAAAGEPAPASDPTGDAPAA